LRGGSVFLLVSCRPFFALTIDATAGTLGTSSSFAGAVAFYRNHSAAVPAKINPPRKMLARFRDSVVCSADSDAFMFSSHINLHRRNKSA
jgi:hypothetical protein